MKKSFAFLFLFLICGPAFAVDPLAKRVQTDTTNFNSNLSASNTNVQSALETLDNIPAMSYPGAGIALSTGSAWGTSITNNSANWNTAYGWGNHAAAGYLTSESDPQVGTLTASKWCTSDGSAVNCATNAPVLTEVDPTVDSSSEIQAIIGAGVYQASDSDLTSLAGGITGVVKGAGNGSGYSAASAGTDYEVPITAGDGLTRTINEFDCDTASGSVFGCLTAADWTTFNSKQPAGAYLTAVVADSPLSGSGTAASHLTVDLSSKQAADAGLTSLAGLTYASTSFVKMTGADTFTLDTSTYLTSEVDGSITNEIEVVDEIYSAANFNGGTTTAVSQDDLYDLIHAGDSDDDGKPDILDTATNGFVKTTGGTGAISIDTSTYLTTEVDGSVTNEIQNLFETVNAPAGTDPVADTSTDTLNLAVSGIVTITGDSTTDTITIGAAEVDGSTTNEIQNLFQTVDAPAGTDPVADTSTDTLQFLVGGIVTITGDATGDSVTISATEVDGSTTNEIEVEDDVYGVGWNGDTTHAPSQNAVYDAGFLTANQTITLSGHITGSGTTAITTTFNKRYLEVMT